MKFGLIALAAIAFSTPAISAPALESPTSPIQVETRDGMVISSESISLSEHTKRSGLDKRFTVARFQIYQLYSCDGNVLEKVVDSSVIGKSFVLD
jgi:hypothetical protein